MKLFVLFHVQETPRGFMGLKRRRLSRTPVLILGNVRSRIEAWTAVRGIEPWVEKYPEQYELRELDPAYLWETRRGKLYRHPYPTSELGPAPEVE